jgi:CRP-like cAMP-binding protein
MSADVPSLTIDFNHSEENYYGVNKIVEASSEEASEGAHSDNDGDSQSFGTAYDDGWECAASYADMKFQSEEMKNLLKLEQNPSKDKVMKLDYAAEHLFPQWIIENKEWKSTQSKKNENKISDILQIQYANRSVEQHSTLIHWLMSVWPTAYMLGYKRCGQMFKVFHFLTYNPGTDVIVENERGLTFYIVISGTATVHKDGIGVVASISKGQSFGELALTEGNDVRSATVRAHTELELLRLHKVDYDHFVKDIQLAERRENLLVLRDCKIFDNWPRSKIQKMCTTCTRKIFKPGDVIFRQGAVPDCIYFIIDGKVSIHKEIVIIVRNRWPTSNNEWDGVAKKRIKPHPVDELARGSFFGELSIIKNKRRTATAIATTRCVLLCLDKLEFVHLLRSGKAMETVSSFASHYKDDKEILSRTAIHNGGPSTTAQLNEYIKSMDQSGAFNHADKTTRPQTAGAKTRNTIVKRIEEEDEENFNIHASMKYSTPSRQVRRTLRAASISGEGGSPTTFQAKLQFGSNKLDKKHRGALATSDGVPEQEEEVDEHDENYKKMKLKNENKAVNVLADRMKAKLDPLKQNNQKQIKESQLQHMMQEIILANRFVVLDSFTWSFKY